MILNTKPAGMIRVVCDELDLKIKVAIAANDYRMYQKYYDMRDALLWVLGYSIVDLDAILKKLEKPDCSHEWGLPLGPVNDKSQCCLKCGSWRLLKETI